MKLKKVRNVGILLIIAIFSLSSCGLIFNENVDADLGDLANFSVVLDTAVRFLAIDTDISSGSRTVNYNSEADGSPIKSTPEATYTANSGTGSNEIQIPAGNNIIENFYGTNPAVTAKFSMKPEGSGYRIKLFIYDSADFLLDYVYEEYFVTGDNWAPPLDESGHSILDNTGEFFDYYDNMHDGSKVQHSNYLFGPAVSGDDVYTITAESIIDNLTDYKFALKDDGKDPSLFDDATVTPEITIDVAGNFYSYKESSGNFVADQAPKRAPHRPDFESITYYAELGNQTERNMVVFSLQSVEKKKDDYARTVTRSKEVYDDSTDPMTLTSKKVYSFTTYTDKKGKEKQHITKEIEQTLNGSGLTVVSHIEGMYKDKSTVDDNPDTLTTMTLTQDEAPGNDFTGTMSAAKKEKNGSIKTKYYTVTYNGTKFTTTENKGRAAGANKIELDLSLLENGQEFTLSLPGGTRFEGTYFYGRLTGTIRYPSGDIKRVDIVNGIVYLNDELWEPTVF